MRWKSHVRFGGRAGETTQVYVAVVLDAWSRRVVGWAIADHIRAEIAVDALDGGVAPAAARGPSHLSLRPRNSRRIQVVVATPRDGCHHRNRTAREATQASRAGPVTSSPERHARPGPFRYEAVATRGPSGRVRTTAARRARDPGAATPRTSPYPRSARRASQYLHLLRGRDCNR